MVGAKKKIVLIGGGGHAKVIIDAVNNAKKFRIYGIIDPAFKKGTSVLGVPVIGTDNILLEIFKKDIKYAFIGVGSIGNCEARRRIYDSLKKIGFQLPVIVHPKAIVSGSVECKEGTFVAAGAVINPGVKIGKNAIINTSVSIDHDCVIEDFVHIAPGVILSGGVKVGDETHIGTGANVIQNIKIGRGCFVAAGSLVKDDQSDGARCGGAGSYARTIG